MSRYLAGYRERVSGEVLRCPACARENHRACQGRPDGPPDAECQCRQCWLGWSMEAGRKAMNGNNLAAMRTALAALWAIQFQTSSQRQARARRGPIMLSCQECGRPVKVWRPDRRAVYCRDQSKCRLRPPAGARRPRPDLCRHTSPRLKPLRRPARRRGRPVPGRAWIPRRLIRWLCGWLSTAGSLSSGPRPRSSSAGWNGRGAGI